MNLLVFLYAISMVETGVNDTAIGSAHEVSRYQIKPQVWQQYSLLRKQNYTNPEIAYKVASQHVKHLQATMPAFAGDSVLHLAAAWNWGSGNLRTVGYSITNLPPSVTDYTKRVKNIYDKCTPPEVLRIGISSLGTNDKNSDRDSTFEVNIRTSK